MLVELVEVEISTTNKLSLIGTGTVLFYEARSAVVCVGRRQDVRLQRYFQLQQTTPRVESEMLEPLGFFSENNLSFLI